VRNAPAQIASEIRQLTIKSIRLRVEDGVVRDDIRSAAPARIAAGASTFTTACRSIPDQPLY